MLQRGEAAAKLAIADQDSPNIHIFDIRSGSEEPLEQIRPHRSSVEHMQYNAAHDVVISIDGKGEQRCAQLVLQQKRGGQAASAQKRGSRVERADSECCQLNALQSADWLSVCCSAAEVPYQSCATS